VDAERMSRRFVLVDRDGTVNEEVDHLSEPEDLIPIPGSVEALAELRALGLGIVVVTNQANVGRGLLPQERLDAIHARFRELLAAGGVEVDGLYVCPHAPEAGCDCRKPQPGLALRAAADHGFDPSRAFVVGDHAADMGMGRAVGATTILVGTGHGLEELADGAGELADHVVADLAEAVGVIRRVVVEAASR
jgi:D-glycero-D-manno-heptose 1,7-bisphosphate phosphatase